MNQPQKDTLILKRPQAGTADVMVEAVPLRDYFAAKVADKCLHEFWGESTAYQDAAEAAYQFADAMLKARAAK